MVLIGHADILMGDFSPTLLGFLFSFLIIKSNIGLLFFFSISGYLVAGSWLRDQNLLRYLFRRTLRLFPALIVVVLLTVFLLGPIFTTLSLHDYLTNSESYAYLSNAVLLYESLLPGVFLDNPQRVVNGSLWTLSVEFMLYLCLPLFAFSKGLKNILIFVSVTAILGLLATFYSDNYWIFNVTYVSMFFMAGVSTRYIWQEKHIPLRLSTFLFVLTIAFYGFTDTNSYLFNIWLAFSLSFFIIALGQSTKFNLPRFNYFGDLSYGVYLYAFPIQQIVAHFFIGEISVLTSIVWTTILTLLCAFASWHLIEKRSLALKPKAYIDSVIV